MIGRKTLISSRFQSAQQRSWWWSLHWRSREGHWVVGWHSKLKYKSNHSCFLFTWLQWSACIGCTKFSSRFQSLNWGLDGDHFIEDLGRVIGWGQLVVFNPHASSISLEVNAPDWNHSEEVQKIFWVVLSLDCFVKFRVSIKIIITVRWSRNWSGLR